MTPLFTPALVSVLILVVGALIILTFTSRFAEDSPWLTTIGLVTLVVAMLPVFGADATTVVALSAVLIASAVAMLLVPSAELEDPSQRPEIAALVLLGSAGAIVLATAGDLLSAVLGLETLALSAAVMIGLGRGSRPLEAAFKYFVLGSISFAALLYGLGLVFLATGSFAWPTLVGVQPAYQWILLAGIVLVGLGFAYELALVPLHWGALDAYTAGAPALSGYVMAASKVGAVLALSRLLTSAGVPLSTILVWIGLISIVWGTIGALAQFELRRLLAYSTVANAGFLALALGCGADGRAAAVFYMAVYVLTALMIFATVAGRGTGPLPLAELRAEGLGVGRSIALGIGLLSLAGIPPLPGFWAKLAVLDAAWQMLGFWPTLVAALGGAAGVLYYLRPLPNLLAVARVAAAERLPTVAPAIFLAGAAIALLALAPGLAYTLARLAAGT